MKSGLDWEEYEEERKTELTWKNVRERNLKINIAKQLIKNDLQQKDIFTKEELKDLFSFKESDIAYIAEDLFETSNKMYQINPELKNFLDKVFKSFEIVQPSLQAAEAEYIRIYGGFRESLEKNSYWAYSNDRFRTMYGKLKEIIPIIHWERLPLFNRYLIYNRGRNPETEMIEFYNHPDCLNALMDEILNKGIVLSNKSDLSLNREMKFEVYTRRWGHEDRYTIKRTIDGWYCGHMSINGKCKKNGEGGLFDNLDHDAVFYPQEGVEYAMQKLWEAADEGEIDFQEMEKRLQEIADWISTVEKSIDSQPEWVNYY